MNRCTEGRRAERSSSSAWATSASVTRQRAATQGPSTSAPICTMASRSSGEAAG